jgi:quinoprotein glucose dehydrogenase
MSKPVCEHALFAVPRLILIFSVLGFTIPSEVGYAGQPLSGEWPCYGRDPGGMRHSPLTQLTRQNVSQLTVAWVYHTRELETYKGTVLARKAAFEATPLMVEGTLFLSTPTNRVIALDASTGAERWVFDPKLNLRKNYSEVTSRGVAMWLDMKQQAGRPKQRRIFVGTIDGTLIGLDAATGRPLDDFGNHGTIDLKVGVGPARQGQYQVTSPPAVIGDLVVVGSSIGDNYAVKDARGVVRAYDARTGKLRWSWDPIPRKPGEPGYETWGGPIAHETGAANAWPPSSVDVERDLVFVPTTAPSPDYYGGQRVGKNECANAVVALRGSTGELVWYFQTVHHDLWDYDTPMEPVLMTLEQRGKQVPAVSVGTKSGHIFVLHRETGKPLSPVEERPVPQSDVPGEQTWPTQPFPIKLPVFGLRRITPDDAWGPTAEDREVARKRIAELRYEGPFTPASLKGSIQAPSNVGGFNWGGLSYDPVRTILTGAVNRTAAIARLVPRAEGPRFSGNNRLGIEVGIMLQTPYLLHRSYMLDLKSHRLPYTKPPWGTLAAVNLQTNKLQFEVPLGYEADPRKFPEAEQWGSINLGGPMTTAGGLVFVAASMDNHLRAFDIEAGKLLWKGALPAGGQAVPMCYEANHKQFVVICAGGHGKLGTKLGDAVVAFALPGSSP